jgi:hypothetical protein
VGAIELTEGMEEEESYLQTDDDRRDLEMAAEYIAAGPAALAVTLQRLQAALGTTEPIFLPDDPAAQQKAFALKLKELRALLEKQLLG